VRRRAWSISSRSAYALTAGLAAFLAADPALGAPIPRPIPIDAVRAVASVGVEPSSAIDRLEAAGYRVHVALVSHEAGAPAAGRAGTEDATFFITDRGRARGLPAGVRALGATPPWLRLADPAPPTVSSLALMADPSSADPFGGRADALPPPSAEARVRARAGHEAREGIAPPGSTLPSGLAPGTRWEDTSEFMIGRVAVPILFPESDGTVDVDRFSWTAALRDSVVNSAVRGLLKWSLRAAASNIPLTFLIEPHAGLATKYEPIDRPIGQELLWIEDILEPMLGYKGDALTMAYDYANAARARWNAQWVTIAFAVQNDTSGTGTFPDGFIAHANLGGPYFVTPVNNLNTRSATLDYYIEHEMTHQFWALDEYAANNAWWACTLTTGYFNRQNRNASVPASGYCGVPTVHCLMTGNYPDDFCVYTTDQIGWADIDGSGVLDLYETHPIVRPDSTTYRTGAGQTITLRGEAAESALPNRNPYHSGAGDSISIATVDSIEYKLDNVEWLPLPCGDGRCDSGSERFTLTLPPLTPGGHFVEWRAWNSSGRTAPVPSGTTISVSGTSGGIDGGGLSPPVAPRVIAAPAPLRGEARLRLIASPGTRGTAAILDLAGRTVRTWPVAVPSDGVFSWRWDGRGDAGGSAAAGLYFVVVKLGPDTATHRVLLLR